MRRSHDPLANPEALIRRVYGYAAYRLGDGPDAEDATSTTMERALRYRRSYDPSTGTAQAWLLGIARRVVDEHAQRASVASYEPEAQVDFEGDVARATAERLTLRHLLAQLSHDERSLLALRYGADLTARDIAVITGARTNAVEVALHRLLAKLRDQMDGKSSTREAKHECA